MELEDVQLVSGGSLKPHRSSFADVAPVLPAPPCQPPNRRLPVKILDVLVDDVIEH